ncbi:MAG: type IV pilus modification PilV family protein [Bdellovibrionales bacterium]
MTNSRGQSLIEVVIGLAVTAVIILTATTMQSSISKETNAASEKIAAMELEQGVVLALASVKTCKLFFAPANITNPASMPFDETKVSAKTPQFIALNQLPTTMAPLATAGARVSPLSNSLNIRSNAVNPPGIQVAVTSMTPPSGKLYINFDDSKLVRAVHNLEFQIKFQMSGASGNMSIVGCGL